MTEPDRPLDYEHRGIDEPFDAYVPPADPESTRRLWLVTIAIAAVCALVLWLQHREAQAQVPQTRPYCDTPDNAVRTLRDTFGEVPAAIGLDTQDRLISLYVDPNDGSWTLLMTVPGQTPVSCVLSGGESWESAKAPEGAPT